MNRWRRWSAWALTLFTLALPLLLPSRAEAFCGFYVSGASGDLYNDATMVVLMRGGTKTVLSMRNHYKGPPEDFALVVPVPQVLEEENVKVIKDSVFDRVDKLAAPRLVEYWERDPCYRPPPRRKYRKKSSMPIDDLLGSAGAREPMPKVRVEAQFDVGEYNVVILSADESNALEEWLLANKYNIPKGAAKVLKGYIEQGMYFFVAKVDAKKVNFDKRGNAQLSPLRFHYDSKDFSLPVRLGLLNARGKQDLIVHVLSKQGRYEVANYPNATIPTNLIVDGSTRKRFASFYAALFDYTVEQNPGAVVTEYAWSANKCDPCPVGALNGGELLTLGADAIPGAVSYPRGSVRSSVQFGAFELDDTIDEGAFRGEFKRRVGTLRNCHERVIQMTRGKDYPSGEGTFDLTIDAEGRVKSVKPAGGEALEDTGLSLCSVNRIRRFRFPPLQGAEQASARVTLDYTLSKPPGYVDMRGWTLTRLHARYSAKELEQDLVFRKAPAIVGGRGMPQGARGALSEEGAQLARTNAFQGRYVILNRWNKKLTCKSPRRGVWGGPPRGGAKVQAAQDTAFAPRGKVKLSKKLRRQARAQKKIKSN